MRALEEEQEFAHLVKEKQTRQGKQSEKRFRGLTLEFPCSIWAYAMTQKCKQPT